MKKDNKKRILIIEDEKMLLRALKIQLSNNDFDIISAGDGREGLKMVKTEKPDLILLDLLLPKMNGFDVLDNLKKDQETKDIPVIILSNLGQDDDKKKGLELGALDYYIKSSVNPEEVLKRVKQLLGVC